MRAQWKRPAVVWLALLAGLSTLPLRDRPAAALQAERGSPGPHADSCGLDDPAGDTVVTEITTPIYPPGQYPVQLPSVSLLGAPNDLPNPFEPGMHWGELPDGRYWGSTAGIATGPDDTIWVIDRCGVRGAGGTLCLDSDLDPILQFDTEGRLLSSFGRGAIVSPHKITVDAEGSVWVADNGHAPGRGHQVLKFNRQGELVMTLGTAGVPGSGPNQFDAPTEVAVAPNGDIYVADGHSGGGGATGNARIVQFDRSGRFIREWGKKGMGPGEFDEVHSLELDSRGRVFVADRQNNRIQIFDAQGTFIDQWFQFGRPSGIHIDANDVIYVADSESRDARTNNGRPLMDRRYNPGARRGIRIGSARTGAVTAFIPDPCPYPYPGISSMAEGVTTDAAGNVYGAEWLGTVRKYVRR